MALVAYSDSEGSEDESQADFTTLPVTRPTATSNFKVDKKNPGKIKVNLQPIHEPLINGTHEDEPASKRARVGAGAFSGFNSMLPAPKRNGQPSTTNEASKTSTRKVFNLKTAAEASFSRESDAEMRNLFAEQSGTVKDNLSDNTAAPSTIAKPSFAKPPPPAAAGMRPLFKPLSVARNQKKKNKPTFASEKAHDTAVIQSHATLPPGVDDKPVEAAVKQKVNLFSMGTEDISAIPEAPAEPDLYLAEEEKNYPADVGEDIGYPEHNSQTETDPKSQSLNTIASDLNLTAAQKRQLFGRSGQSGASAVNVVNFNTDAEYAANQALIAAGETVQHNPVRAIAPGKHSLRQLVNAASGQKEALEESFAEGKRNKREAGNKYGW